MATKNDITGDALVSKATSEGYRANYDRIFGKRAEKAVPDAEPKSDADALRQHGASANDKLPSRKA